MSVHQTRKALASQAALWVLFSRRCLRAMGTRRLLPEECWSCWEEGGKPGPVVGARHKAHGVRPAVGSCAPRALQRCQEWAAQGEPHSRTAGAAIAAIRTLTGSANNSCGTIFLFGQRGKGHCSQIGLFNNTCMHS